MIQNDSDSLKPRLRFFYFSSHTLPKNSDFNFHNRRSLDDAPGGEEKPNLTSARVSQ